MSERRLPELTHLQFLVLGALHNGPRAGRLVRETLGEYGVHRTAAAFYQMMARLERDRLVEGEYGQILIGDQHVTERRYTITPTGARRWADARAFYASVGLIAARQRLSHA